MKHAPGEVVPKGHKREDNKDIEEAVVRGSPQRDVDVPEQPEVEGRVPGLPKLGD